MTSYKRRLRSPSPSSVKRLPRFYTIDLISYIYSKRKEFPYPPIFERSKDIQITFRNKINTELYNNLDLYSTKLKRLNYQIGRLGGKLYKVIKTYFDEYSILQIKSK